MTEPRILPKSESLKVEFKSDRKRLSDDDLVAAATDNKAEYIRTRAQDDDHYMKLIMDYLHTYESASRQDIDGLIKKHLSAALDDEQKGRKVANLLTKLRRADRIYNAGIDKKPIWKCRVNAE